MSIYLRREGEGRGRERGEEREERGERDREGENGVKRMIQVTVN